MAIRVYESCIGSGCSRSPSPLRREFWESNRPLPDLVIKRKELSLQNELQQVVEENQEIGQQQPLQQQKIAREKSRIYVLSRQERPRIRIKQSRDPLFMYNDTSEHEIVTHFTNNYFRASQNQRDHTLSPRRPRSSIETPDIDNLTVNVDVMGDDEDCQVVSINKSGTNSPHSVNFNVKTSPQAIINNCAFACRSRTPSPRALCSPYQFVDQASSPVLIRSRSPSPHNRRSSQGSIEINNNESTIKVDEDDNGDLHVDMSTSDENTPPSFIYNSCPKPCYQNQNQSPTSACCSTSPTLPCQTQHSNENINQKDDGDSEMEFKWQGNDISIQVDLDNSDHSIPHSVNIKCGHLPSKSRSRSPKSQSPIHYTSRSHSSKSQSSSALHSPDPMPQLPNSSRVVTHPPWDNTSLPTGIGASRLNHPSSVSYKSCSPSQSRSRSTSKSRSKSPSSNSRTLSPRSITPRQINIHHKSYESSHPNLEVDYEHVPKSANFSCSPQRCVGYTRCRSQCLTPCRSQCSTPCRSRCSTVGSAKGGSMTSDSRPESPHCIEHWRLSDNTCSSMSDITIHQSSNKRSTSRSKPSSSTSSFSPSPCGIENRSKSGSTAPSRSKAIMTISSGCIPNSECSPTTPCFSCGSINRCSCHNLSSCHGGDHHNLWHQLQACQSSCSPNTSNLMSSTSCYFCPHPLDNYTRPCNSSYHYENLQAQSCCANFCPIPGDIIIRTNQRQHCPYSSKDNGQVDFFSHRSACGLREGDTIVRLGRFDPIGKWCASDIVRMYILDSHGLWIFLGEEKDHECLKPLQSDQHQTVRTVNRWFRPSLGDLIIHTLPDSHSFYFWNPKKRSNYDDTHLLLRAYIGIPQVVDEYHNISCCTTSHLPVGYAELYINIRNHWLFLGRDDHMFTECEITSPS